LRDQSTLKFARVLLAQNGGKKMSALETSDDERPTNPLHFASQPARMPQDDGTIRPILERLNRGESAYAPPQHGMPVGIDLVDTGRGKRRAWTFIGCAALSAMLAAGVAIGAVAWLGSGSHTASASASEPATTESKHAEAIDVRPKTVRTLSFKSDAVKADPMVKETASAAPAAEPTPAPATPPAQAVEASAPQASPAPQPVQVASADASANPVPNPLLRAAPPVQPKELLSRWSSVPATVGAAPAAETPASPPPEAKDETQAAAAPAEPSHRHAARRASHRHSHARRHHQARAQTARAQAAPAQQPASAQDPAASPWQTAFQSLFSGGSGAAAQPQAPVASFSGAGN
jgi:hypothetical protein